VPISKESYTTLTPCYSKATTQQQEAHKEAASISYFVKEARVLVEA